MATVCIIGAGELGGAVAHALACGEHVRDAVLVDDEASVAAGKALDIQQSSAVTGSHVRLEGGADLARAIGASVCIIADRAGRPSSEWQGDEGIAMLTRLRAYAGEAPIVFAGAWQGGIILAAARELHVPRERLIGSSPSALAAAVRSMAALEARCSPAEVAVAVLGVPPGSLVIPWSEASIGGYALERVLTPVQLTRLQDRVAHLWPPGPYALGQAATRIAEALVSSSRRVFDVLTVLGGEFGLRGRVGVLPAALDARGIAATRVPSLTTRERVQVENAFAGPNATW